MTIELYVPAETLPPVQLYEWPYESLCGGDALADPAPTRTPDKASTMTGTSRNAFIVFSSVITLDLVERERNTWHAVSAKSSFAARPNVR